MRDRDDGRAGGGPAVICKSGLGRCFRYSRVSRVLGRLALKAGLNVAREPRELGQAAQGVELGAGPDEVERRRPADLEIFHWDGNRSLAVDVIITSPTAATWRRGAANGSPGWAAAGAARRKRLPSSLVVSRRLHRSLPGRPQRAAKGSDGPERKN